METDYQEKAVGCPGLYKESQYFHYPRLPLSISEMLTKEAFMFPYGSDLS